MMRAVRRIVVLLGLVAVVTALVRLRGRGGRPPVDSGWRELDVTEPS